jgi:hypothetical protein
LCNSQFVKHDAALADSFEQDIKAAGAGAEVLLAHKYQKGFNHYVQFEGYWLFVPWIYDLFVNDESPPKKKWYVFAEPRTRVNMPRLLTTLGAYDSSKKWFVGKVLKDTYASVTREYNTG